MKILPRTSLVALSLLLLGSARARNELSFHVEQGTTIVRTLTQSTEMELESTTFTMNGEEIPAEMIGDLDMKMRREDRYVVTDVFEALEGGRPTRVRRTYDELGGHETTSFTSPAGEQNDESDYESELEGKSVVFAWDADESSFDKTFASGDEQADDALLEDLKEDMDLRDLLPREEVEEGESWEVDARVFNDTMDPGGDLQLVDKDEEEADDSDDQLDENLSGTITCTYRGTLEENGVRLAVIEVKAEVQTFDEETGPGDEELPEGVESSRRSELSFVLEGELRWDLAAGHAASYELAGEGRITMKQSMSGEMEGESLEQVQVLVLAGTVGFGMQFERGK